MTFLTGFVQMMVGMWNKLATLTVDGVPFTLIIICLLLVGLFIGFLRSS